MHWQGSGAIAALAAIGVALLLSACGGDSEGVEPATVDANDAPPGSGVRQNAWNNVNEQLRGDIIEFGETGSEKELEEAATTVRAYLVARTNDDYSGACSYLSKYMLVIVKGVAKQRGKSGCAAGVESLSRVSTSDEVKGPVEFEPSKIRRKGNRAFVFYTDGYGDVYAQLMKPEEGSWKIQGFEPTRLR